MSQFFIVIHNMSATNLLLSVVLVILLCHSGCLSLQSFIRAELEAVKNLYRDSFLQESEVLSPECTAGLYQLMNSRDQLNISKFYTILQGLIQGGGYGG